MTDINDINDLLVDMNKKYDTEMEGDAQNNQADEEDVVDLSYLLAGTNIDDNHEPKIEVNPMHKYQEQPLQSRNDGLEFEGTPSQVRSERIQNPRR